MSWLNLRSEWNYNNFVFISIDNSFQMERFSKRLDTNLADVKVYEFTWIDRLSYIDNRILITFSDVVFSVVSWWRHQMETFFVLLAICAGIHRSAVNYPHEGLWRGALMFSLICALNKQLSKQSRGWWFEMSSRSLWRHCNDQNHERNKHATRIFTPGNLLPVTYRSLSSTSWMLIHLGYCISDKPCCS